MDFRIVFGISLTAALLGACTETEPTERPPSPLELQESATQCISEANTAIPKLENAQQAIEKVMASYGSVETEESDFYVEFAINRLSQSKSEIEKLIADSNIKVEKSRELISIIDSGASYDISDARMVSKCGSNISYYTPLYIDRWKELDVTLKEEEADRIARNSRREQIDEINETKRILRGKATRVFSTTDAYGDAVQLFHMPNGETLECTTDLGGDPPLFWCDGAAHKKYLK